MHIKLIKENEIMKYSGEESQKLLEESEVWQYELTIKVDSFLPKHETCPPYYTFEALTIFKGHVKLSIEIPGFTYKEHEGSKIGKINIYHMYAYTSESLSEYLKKWCDKVIDELRKHTADDNDEIVKILRTLATPPPRIDKEAAPESYKLEQPEIFSRLWKIRPVGKGKYSTVQPQMQAKEGPIDNEWTFIDTPQTTIEPDERGDYRDSSSTGEDHYSLKESAKPGFPSERTKRTKGYFIPKEGDSDSHPIDKVIDKPRKHTADGNNEIVQIPRTLATPPPRIDKEATPESKKLEQPEIVDADKDFTVQPQLQAKEGASFIDEEWIILDTNPSSKKRDLSELKKLEQKVIVNIGELLKESLKPLETGRYSASVKRLNNLVENVDNLEELVFFLKMENLIFKTRFASNKDLFNVVEQCLATIDKQVSLIYGREPYNHCEDISMSSELRRFVFPFMNKLLDYVRRHERPAVSVVRMFKGNKPHDDRVEMAGELVYDLWKCQTREQLEKLIEKMFKSEKIKGKKSTLCEIIKELQKDLSDNYVRLPSDEKSSDDIRKIWEKSFKDYPVSNTPLYNLGKELLEYKNRQDNIAPECALASSLAKSPHKEERKFGLTLMKGMTIQKIEEIRRKYPVSYHAQLLLIGLKNIEGASNFDMAVDLEKALRAIVTINNPMFNEQTGINQFFEALSETLYQLQATRKPQQHALTLFGRKSGGDKVLLELIKLLQESLKATPQPTEAVKSVEDEKELDRSDSDPDTSSSIFP